MICIIPPSPHIHTPAIDEESKVIVLFIMRDINQWHAHASPGQAYSRVNDFINGPSPAPCGWWWGQDGLSPAEFAAVWEWGGWGGVGVLLFTIWKATLL